MGNDIATLPSSGELIPQSFLFDTLVRQINTGNPKIIISLSQLCWEMGREETEVCSLLWIHRNRSWQSKKIVAHTYDMVGDVCWDLPMKFEGVPDTQVLVLSDQIARDIYDLKIRLLGFMRDRWYELDDPSGFVLIDLWSDMAFVKKAENALLRPPDIRALWV